MNRCFLDTNILLRLFLISDRRHPEVRAATGSYEENGFALCCFPQQLRELWLVLRRDTTMNGYGFDSVAARGFLDRVRQYVTVLDEPPGASTEWLRLVSKYDVSGKTTHDTNIVACMSVLGERRLLTLNLADFQRYEEIEPKFPGTF